MEVKGAVPTQILIVESEPKNYQGLHQIRVFERGLIVLSGQIIGSILFEKTESWMPEDWDLSLSEHPNKAFLISQNQIETPYREFENSSHSHIPGRKFLYRKKILFRF